MPQGTKLTVRVRTNLPLREASVAIGTEEPRPMELAEPDLARFEVVADKNLRYALRLVGTNGEENDPGADTFLLQVVQDQPPSIRVRTPAAQSEYLAGAVVLIAFASQDDYRVESVTLLVSEIPVHTHTLRASSDTGDLFAPSSTASLAGSRGATAYQPSNAGLVQMAPQALPPAGGGLPHNNMQPYLTLNFCIALQGIFPQRP